MSEQLTITHLNNRAEGMALYNEKEIAVPFTLPGEVVEVEIIEDRKNFWGKLTKITTPSKDRVDAPCPHYQVCGGCSLQHLNDLAYEQFKRHQVESVLKAQGLDDKTLQDPIIIGTKVRRRVDFMARRFPDRLAMGYAEKNNRRRIDLETCVIVDPRIEKLFNPLRTLLDSILGLREETHIFILAAENGIDLLLAGFKRDLTDGEKQALENFAVDQGLLRLTYKIKKRAVSLFQREAPYVLFAGQKMDVNPNVFLQASAKADKVLSDIVVKALPKNTEKVADLFCGRGTLSLPLATKAAQVHGFEGDKHAIKALNELNIPNLKAEVRDLFEQPLLTEELREYDAVVLNPPRSGVKEQVHHVVEAKVPCVIYMSCNPETLAKDMKVLVDGGYELKSIVPVDQFMWSHHIEVIAVAQIT